jgi:alpha-glucosidase (family GH31 glycosyl hydrolase)
VKQYTDEPVDTPINVTVYPGADGAFALYEDDGKTFAHKAGDFMQLAMSWNDAARRFTMALAPGSRLRPPSARVFTVRLAASAASRRVVFEGKPVDIVLQ